MRSFLLFIITVFSVWSCKEDQTELFQMEFETEFTIDASLNTILTHYFPINNVSTNYSLFAGSTDINSVGSIRSLSCKMTSIFSPIDYDFIEEISVIAIDPSDSSVRRELFYLDPNPLGNGTEMEMFSSLTNNKELLSKDLLHLEIRIKLRYNAPTTFEIRLVLTFQAFDTE